MKARRRSAIAIASVIAAASTSSYGCGSCGSCGGDGKSGASSSASPGASSSSSVSSAASLGAPNVVAETIPRCRADAKELLIPGDDVVVGDAVIAANEILVGALRAVDGKRVASVVRAPLDLARANVIDLGAPFGEDPPPSPRLAGGASYVAFYVRKSGDAGADERDLRVTKLEPSGLGATLGTIAQQADESTSFDVAWASAPDAAAAPLVAWDEDAPIAVGQFLADRGRVKVAFARGDVDRHDKDKTRVPSPYASDADSPALLARPGASPGYWLAWLARRPENPDAGGAALNELEGAGEYRAYKWVEIVALDANGDVASPIRRVSPDKGHVVSFQLAEQAGAAELVLLVQDEGAHAEGAGSRIVRYAVGGDKIDGSEIVDGGVGRALFEVTHSNDAGAARWLTWTDPTDHAHLAPLSVTLTPLGAASLEPALDGARVLAAADDGSVYALATADSHATLRRLTCR